MRVCAVSLPNVRIELVRESLEPARARIPLAVVVAEPPMSEAKLLGSTRLSVVSREARALGVAPGQTIAQARARAGDLTVCVVRPSAVHGVLARVAEVGLAFGATVSLGMGASDVVWIDVTGCAHLHAPRSSSSIFDGETILAARLAKAIGALGYTCAIAIADGPRVAAMLARASGEASLRASRRRSLEPEPIVVPTGGNAAAIAPLPIAALPLAPKDARWLAKLGVRTIDELRSLPRDGLGARLGLGAREVLALLDGDDRAPLTPYVPPVLPEEQLELEYGVEGTQALTFVAKTLADRLSARLQGRAVATSRLELELRLDAAMLREAEPGGAAQAVVAVELPAPLSTATELLAALRPKLERLVLHAPVLGAALRASVLVPRRAAPLSLFEPLPKAERALPRLVAELASELGPEAVCSLALGDGWRPEERSRLVPFGTASTTKRARRLLSSVPEPTRLLDEPLPIARDAARVTRHLSRLEAVEWWRQPPSALERRTAVDYVQAWTDDGAALVELDRATGSMRVRGWFD